MFGYFLVNPSFTAMSCASFSDEYNMTDPDCDDDASPEVSTLFFEHEIIPAINRITADTAAIRFCISFSQYVIDAIVQTLRFSDSCLDLIWVKYKSYRKFCQCKFRTSAEKTVF